MFYERDVININEDSVLLCLSEKGCQNINLLLAHFSSYYQSLTAATFFASC